MTAAVPTPGAYLARCRRAAGLSIDDVADRVETDPRLDARSRRAWIAMMEADIAPIGADSVQALRRCFPFSPAALARYADLARGGGDAPSLCACARAPLIISPGVPA